MAKRFIKERKHKINSEVRFPEVRLIGVENAGVMTSFEASKLAEQSGKDLILISETTNPPIVKIEEYGKFLYEIDQKEKASRKNAKRSEIREISLSLNIADHDLGIKSKKAIEFLQDGDKVKCALMLKGRENNKKEMGELVMLKFAKLVDSDGIPEAMPRLESNKWLMIIKPKSKKN